MSSLTLLRLIQFRAGYNVVVHAALEHGLFAKHGLVLEVEYTTGSLYLSEHCAPETFLSAILAPTTSSRTSKVTAAQISFFSWVSTAAC